MAPTLSGDLLVGANASLCSDAFTETSPLATCRSDIALLTRYAELYQVPQSLIHSMQADTSRRRQRIAPPEAISMLQSLGLNTAIFRGDLKDLEETGRPVIAIMQPTIYLLVLLVERRVVVAQAGQGLYPVTIKRADFNHHWTQGWIVGV